MRFCRHQRPKEGMMRRKGVHAVQPLPTQMALYMPQKNLSIISYYQSKDKERCSIVLIASERLAITDYDNGCVPIINI